MIDSDRMNRGYVTDANREEERGNKTEKVATSTRDRRPAATSTRNRRDYDKWDEPRPREREEISDDLKQVAALARSRRPTATPTRSRHFRQTGVLPLGDYALRRKGRVKTSEDARRRA